MLRKTNFGIGVLCRLSIKAYLHLGTSTTGSHQPRLSNQFRSFGRYNNITIIITFISCCYHDNRVDLFVYISSLIETFLRGNENDFFMRGLN